MDTLKLADNISRVTVTMREASRHTLKHIKGIRRALLSQLRLSQEGENPEEQTEKDPATQPDLEIVLALLTEPEVRVRGFLPHILLLGLCGYHVDLGRGAKNVLFRTKVLIDSGKDA